MTDEQLTLICPPVRTSCFSDENPISFLVRLANQNTYPSYRWLLSGKSTETINYELLYNTLLATDWTGYQQTVPELQEICSLSNIHINSSRLRYCPLCLQEESYWRIGWQIKLAAACTRHQIWLRDLCPHCHREYSFLKAHKNQCVCLEQLTNAEAVPVPPSVLQMQQFLEKGLLNQQNNLFDTNHQLSIVERCELIAFMLKWQDIGEDLAKPTRQKLEYVSDFQDNVIRCAEALFSDQNSFWRFLQTIHLSHASYIDIQQKRLVYFYRQFLKQFFKPSFQPLRDIVENYATMNLIRDITDKHTLFSPNAKKVQLWCSFQKACKEYGIASSVLSRAITDKQVKVHHEYAEKYTKSAVYRPDLEKILPHLKMLIPANFAAHILGVTKAQFSQLQNSGCFKFETPPRIGYCSTWQYSQPELSAIIENINRGAAPSTSACLTISQIMQYHIQGRIEMPFLQLIKAILSGRLIVRKSDPQILKIRALSIDGKEFMRWLNNLRPTPEYMSVTEASKLLGIHEEFTYQLVNRGYLHHKMDSRNAKVIFPDHIRQFKQDYVILSKLSEESEMSSARIVEILESLEIFPADHKHYDKLRQKLYTRADILKTGLLYRYVQYLPE
ncbi:MAG: TniQ family protein [Methylobacter sp.]|uniref:TniQ family protein n=1 Tax=Methylobacter sp. TaxID=2051955 RepID=UPI0025D34F1C|nr:TniQ family protein [Methylobacter sp.]MCK9621781.1 TniQ family protein [Methylobacter sp.]